MSVLDDIERKSKKVFAMLHEQIDRIADLKRQLADRNVAVEEAEARLAEVESKLRETRARADALAGHMEVLIHEAVPRNHAEDRLWNKAQSLINVHRQAREEG